MRSVGEKLKFRPMAGQLILRPEAFSLGTTLEVVAAGAGAKAQIGQRVRLNEPSVNPRVVNIDGVSYHMHLDGEVQVIPDES